MKMPAPFEDKSFVVKFAVTMIVAPFAYWYLPTAVALLIVKFG